MAPQEVVYLISDYRDPTSLKRANAMRQVCPRVVVAGFERHINATTFDPRLEPIELGEAKDRAYGMRLLAMLPAIWRLRKLRHLPRDSVIWARNTDMLALAVALAILNGFRPKIVFELLDISAVQTSAGLAGLLIRSFERLISPLVSAVVVSSPAFARNYVRGRIASKAPIYCWENKLPAGTYRRPPLRVSESDGPLRIAWIGKFRCVASMNFLADLAERAGPHVRVDLHGIGAQLFRDQFQAALARSSRLIWHGEYDSDRDLGRLYEMADLSWAVDLSRFDFNSRWLLPNKLYESGLFNVPVIAMEGTDLGARVSSEGIGLALKALDVDEFLASLPEIRRKAAAAKARLAATPESTFVFTTEARDILAAVLAKRPKHKGLSTDVGTNPWSYRDEPAL